MPTPSENPSSFTYTADQMSSQQVDPIVLSCGPVVAAIIGVRMYCLLLD